MFAKVAYITLCTLALSSFCISCTEGYDEDRNADGNNNAQVPTFQPYYYFLGLNYSAMYNNATLMQTIGWDDYSHGGMGTYDPLEEDPSKLSVDNSYKK